MRNVLGTRNLGDILSEREAIASEMQEGLDEATDPWGVLVERVEVSESSRKGRRGLDLDHLMVTRLHEVHLTVASSRWA